MVKALVALFGAIGRTSAVFEIAGTALGATAAYLAWGVPACLAVLAACCLLHALDIQTRGST